ncbi:hypothetical protein [Burkholderia sp. WSM2230]|uniref:hypothetical protein n=1 Tax=Burkholderia sp. WSM2230 TaxID=944435 RepID=UPI0012EB4396|nr:hypothetical protein [Burkholderia sp. WSM2230]
MREDALGIGDGFAHFRVPRSRTPSHDLTEMLVAALFAMLSGTDSCAAIQKYAEAMLEL